MSKGSVLVARVMAIRLGRFWDFTMAGPCDLLKIDSKEVENLLVDRFDEFERAK
ncbi:MAG: hypothetical protein QW342_00710 [Thermoproteota archaeon]